MNNILNIRAKDFQILNYLSVKNTHLISLVLFFLWLSYTEVSFGQTMGMVIKPALILSITVQYPDGDGYVSPRTNGGQLGFLYRFRISYLAPSSKSNSIMNNTDGKLGFARTKANPKAAAGIPGFQAESVSHFNVPAYNVKGIVFMFAQLCAQVAQFTPLFIQLNKIG